MGPLPGGDRDDCLLKKDPFPGNGRSWTFNRLGMPEIDMGDINRSSTSVPYMANDDLHTLKRCEEKLGEDGSKRTHRNWCRLCYRHGKCTLSKLYCEECSECVCPDVSRKDSF